MDLELFVLFAKVYIIFDIANYNNIVLLFCYWEILLLTLAFRVLNNLPFPAKQNIRTFLQAIPVFASTFLFLVEQENPPRLANYSIVLENEYNLLSIALYNNHHVLSILFLSHG